MQTTITRTIMHMCRYLLGILMLIGGLNGFLEFLAVPWHHPHLRMMNQCGFLSVPKSIEIVGGLCLLANRYVIPGLAMLGPVIINIVCFHWFMDRRGIEVGITTLILWSVLMIGYRRYYLPLMVWRAEPGGFNST